MFFVMPETPAKATFLTSEQRDYVQHILIEDGIISRYEEDDMFSWVQVVKTLLSPQVLVLAIAGFFNGMFNPDLVQISQFDLFYVSRVHAIWAGLVRIFWPYHFRNDH